MEMPKHMATMLSDSDFSQEDREILINLLDSDQKPTESDQTFLPPLKSSIYKKQSNPLPPPSEEETGD
jgi:hypothetical protein